MGRTETSDTALLRDAWWALQRGARALEAERLHQAAVAEMRQTMMRIHRVLENRI